MNPFLQALISLAVLVKSADWTVKSGVRIAHKFGVSEFAAGFVAIAIGTSLPELVVSVMASLGNQGELALGNVLGSNIADVTLVLGALAVLKGRIRVTSRFVKRDVYFILPVVLLPVLFGIDGLISRFEGLVLLTIFFYYLHVMLKQSHAFKSTADMSLEEMRHPWVWLPIGVAGVVFSADYLIDAFMVISETFGLPMFFMGLTVVALGTSLPELAVELRAIHSAHEYIALGDILGSVVANTTLVIGVAALINPLPTPAFRFLGSVMFMVTSVFLCTLFLESKLDLDRREGIALLLVYLTFLISEIDLELLASSL